MPAVVLAMWTPERRALALLLLALSTVFVFNEPERFHRWNSDHAGITLDHMRVALNRSPEHGFLGFDYQLLNSAGERTYQPYNRFPIAGSLLIKAVVLPFADDFGAQILAARMLMLAFFAAAVVFGYLALRRLAPSPSVALAATALAFSSFHTLHYADMVATEGPMDLFAVMLVFHALVVFVQHRRFAQLLAKTCVAVAIGWHVFALLLPFVVLGLFGEWRRGGRIAGLLRSRLVVLGAVALSFGLSMLALNFALEYAALAKAPVDGTKRETALTDLPSLQALPRRLAWRAEPLPGYAPPRQMLQTLLERAGRAALPYAGEQIARILLGARPNSALDGAAGASPPRRSPGGAGGFKLRAAMLWGGIVCIACLGGLAFSRHRVLLAALASSGFCWGLLAPGSVPQHAFEGMFLVGLALAFFLVLLMQAVRWTRRWFPRPARLMDGCAAAALLIFVISGQQMSVANAGDGAMPGRFDGGELQPDFQALLADMRRIRDVAPPGAVVIPSAAQPGITANLLTERVLLSPLNGRQRHRADFVLTREQVASAGLLTPENRYLFLYERSAYDARYANLGHPALQGGDWNVHVVGNRLIFSTGNACAARSTQHEPPLFVDIVSGFRAAHRRRAVPRFEFAFHDSAFEVAGRCVAEFALSSHNVGIVRTGQTAPGRGVIWHQELTVDWPRLLPRWPTLARSTDRLLFPGVYQHGDSSK